MTIDCQLGHVDAHGAITRGPSPALEAEHQAILRDVPATGDFWQQAQTAGSNTAGTDSSAGSSWA